MWYNVSSQAVTKFLFLLCSCSLGQVGGLHYGSSLSSRWENECMCGNNSANLSPDLVPDFSKGFTFPGSTTLVEEEGSISHLSLSLENMAYLKIKFQSSKRALRNQLAPKLHFTDGEIESRNTMTFPSITCQYICNWISARGRGGGGI